ncbi:hypothetical protein BJX70DRAFT_305918 [Aspergillus crustosus]
MSCLVAFASFSAILLLYLDSKFLFICIRSSLHGMQVILPQVRQVELKLDHLLGSSCRSPPLSPSQFGSPDAYHLCWNVYRATTDLPGFLPWLINVDVIVSHCLCKSHLMC